MKPTNEDYEAIHKNSGMDLTSFAIWRGINDSKVLEYIAKRTDVAFRRGYWRAKQESNNETPDTATS